MCKTNCTQNCAQCQILNTKYHISDSNLKLQPSKDTNFMIWNLPACSTCPYRTPMCVKYCYARKAEKCYPQVLPARQDNLEMSKLPSFVSDMTEFILDRLKRQRKPHLVNRIHESGDFYNKRYTNDWLDIIDNVKCRIPKGKDVKHIAYTKSFPYFDGIHDSELVSMGLYLRASLWDDTKPEMKEIVYRNGWKIYTAVPQFTPMDSFFQCRCEDCATCSACWSDIPLICCEIH